MPASPEHRGAPDRRRLIESHLPLVRAIAKRYAGQGESLEDLVQVGSVALVKASDRFDPERGVAFASFATPAVEGEIRRHLGDRSGSVRVPRGLRRMTGDIERCRVQLASSLGREPTLGEIAATLEVEPEEIEQALEAERAREPAAAVSEDAAEAAGAAESPLESSDDRLLLSAGAHVLDERERRIVFLRFHADRTEREIARELGISQPQVSRLLAGALAKLREALDDENFSKTGADTTGQPVISRPQRGAQEKLRRSDGGKRPASGEGETKIAPVAASEEQAYPAGAAAPAKQDLALPYRVTVKPEGEGRGSSWLAAVEELPGCEARGASADEAVEKLRSVMETWLSAAVEEPRVLAPPKRSSSKRKPSSGQSGRFLVRMPSELHEELTRAAEREQVSLNRFVTAKLAAAVAASGNPAPASETAPRDESAPGTQPRRKRGFRILLAVNVIVIVLAAAAAITLLILALERGV